MDEDVPGVDPVLVIDDDHAQEQPVDPDNGDFSDESEGALENGAPVPSVYGSENTVWGGA